MDRVRQPVILNIFFRSILLNKQLYEISDVSGNGWLIPCTPVTVQLTDTGH